MVLTHNKRTVVSQILVKYLSVSFLVFLVLHTCLKPALISNTSWPWEIPNNGSLVVPQKYPDICQVKGYLLVMDRGRLGNQISQYATLYAMAKIYQIPPAISTMMKSYLSQLFPYISIPTYDLSRCKFPDRRCDDTYENILQGLNGSSSPKVFQQKIMSGCATNVVLRSLSGNLKI
jgi:hypothetical protein